MHLRWCVLQLSADIVLPAAAAIRGLALKHLGTALDLFEKTITQLACSSHMLRVVLHPPAWLFLPLGPGRLLLGFLLGRHRFG